ncbi:MAG TPA: D-glycero-beta-D-manno-heptose 1-phosphate adenylyltransferase [Candidatus Omnitrophica bacterium]|nr:D-glycero-beta-D-manno-heptose 1-phosphate adenylyltransferase [Candidatus Omnitrophota bacterium]
MSPTSSIQSKIISRAQLPALRRRFLKLHKKIVFTNGTFDILHRGHVSYLEKARAAGDLLVVGVNSDSSVRSYKGPGRPVNPEKDRLFVLAALQCVDYVVLFSDSTPFNLIMKMKPDVLAKGADWKLKDIVGAPEVMSWGGKVKRIQFVKGRSSTKVINKLAELASKL